MRFSPSTRDATQQVTRQREHRTVFCFQHCLSVLSRVYQIVEKSQPVAAICGPAPVVCTPPTVHAVETTPNAALLQLVGVLHLSPSSFDGNHLTEVLLDCFLPSCSLFLMVGRIVGGLGRPCRNGLLGVGLPRLLRRLEKILFLEKRRIYAPPVVLFFRDTGHQGRRDGLGQLARLVDQLHELGLAPGLAVHAHHECFEVILRQGVLDRLLLQGTRTPLRLLRRGSLLRGSDSGQPLALHLGGKGELLLARNGVLFPVGDLLQVSREEVLLIGVLKQDTVERQNTVWWRSGWTDRSVGGWMNDGRENKSKWLLV